MAFADAVIDPSLSDYMDRIEEMYNAPFVREIGIELVSMDDREVRTRIELRPELMNSHGIGHGGVVYALADHTFAFASNIRQDATGQSATISYFRPATGKHLNAVSTLVNDSRSLGVYKVDVFNDAGKLVASGMFTSFKIRRE